MGFYTKQHACILYNDMPVVWPRGVANTDLRELVAVSGGVVLLHGPQHRGAATERTSCYQRQQPVEGHHTHHHGAAWVPQCRSLYETVSEFFSGFGRFLGMGGFFLFDGVVWLKHAKG